MTRNKKTNSLKKGAENSNTKTLITVAVIGAVATILAAVIPFLLKNESAKLPLTLTPDIVSVLQPTSTSKPFPDEIIDDYGVPMRLVPTGEFTMGSDFLDEEKPVHRIYLDQYYIDKYEVTNAMYSTCVEEGKCLPPHDDNSHLRGGYYYDPQFSNFPVINVDWEMAHEFCVWRGARLPSEAEWEKAARGKDGNTFPWGEGISCNLANHFFCVGETTEVGGYEDGKSTYGVYDMAGNVWEWVNSSYRSYPYKQDDRENIFNLTEPGLMRGGAWDSSEIGVRSAYRAELDRSAWTPELGFRCASWTP